MKPGCRHINSVLALNTRSNSSPLPRTVNALMSVTIVGPPGVFVVLRNERSCRDPCILQSTLPVRLHPDHFICKVAANLASGLL